MFRLTTLLLILALFVAPTFAIAAEITGTYLEARTCQVYTGPCFANGEIGLAGHDAMMAWNIDEGKRDGVNLSGLSVIVVVNASETLAFQGLNDPKRMKSIILVDEKADEQQKSALIAFAKEHAGRAGESVVNVESTPINMTLDTSELRGHLTAGTQLKLTTRAARRGDCICSNESAYYPPLAKVEHFAPGVAIEGAFKGRGLGSRWSIPDDRSAYMGTFVY